MKGGLVSCQLASRVVVGSERGARISLEINACGFEDLARVFLSFLGGIRVYQQTLYISDRCSDIGVL